MKLDERTGKELFDSVFDYEDLFEVKRIARHINQALAKHEVTLAECFAEDDKVCQLNVVRPFMGF